MPLPCLVVVLMVAWSPGWAGSYLTYQDGVEEYDRGNVAAAFATYQRLAETGDARSQEALALMYQIGEAVTQDHAAAARWFRRAAEQGLPTAQIGLARMYAAGQGVPRDEVEALRWFTLAELLADDRDERALARGNRSAIAKRVAAAELARARGLTCEWWHDNAWLLAAPPPAPAFCGTPGR